MNTEELLVHDSCKREGAEGIHAGVIYSLRVLVLAFKLEGEIIGQVTTLMVTAQKPERLGIVYLQ